MKIAPFITILLYFLANVYIGIRGWQALSRLRFLRFFFVPVMLLITIAPFITFLFEPDLLLSLNYFFYQVSYNSIILMIYVLMIIVFIDVFNYLFIKTGLISGGITYSYRRTKLIVMFATVVIVSMCAIGGYVRFCNPEVVKYPVEINKKVTTPVKIVIASDLHLGYLINKKITKNFVDFINAQQPDIVLFVGDIIDRSMRPLYAEKMYEELRNIKANIGVFGVWGNHEKYVKNDSIVKDFYSQSHIILLQDERIDLTPDIVLVGRDDYKNRQRDSLNSLLDGVDTSKIILVLDHQPSAANEAIKNNADILLCGHTHKGQVFPLNYVVSMMYKYSYGYKKVNKTNIIVSSGLGLCGGLFRIGTQSEIVVLNVE